MPPNILDYLKTQRVGVLAVEMLDGSPHAATVHFAHGDNPFTFYFSTTQTYRKAEPLLKNGKARATFVVGFDEKNMKTLQVDGEVKLVAEKEQDEFMKIYYGKFPEKVEKTFGAPNVYFVLIPTWWRFTDWTLPEGKKIWSSEDRDLRNKM